MDKKHRRTDLKSQIDPAILETLNTAKKQHISKGVRIPSETDHCHNFIWLLEGRIRVFKNSAHGREITLYRVNPGETCILNLRHLLLGKKYSFEAVTETDVSILTLTHEQFLSAIDNSHAFRYYILNFMSQSISSMIDLVSEVTFEQLELRLARLLSQLFERSNGHPLAATHAQLANELGTSREVISRILKEFECQKCIRLARGKIDLVSSENLNWLNRQSN